MGAAIRFELTIFGLWARRGRPDSPTPPVHCRLLVAWLSRGKGDQNRTDPATFGESLATLEHAPLRERGEAGGTRTHDKRIRSPLLCPTELPPREEWPVAIASI